MAAGLTASSAEDCADQEEDIEWLLSEDGSTVEEEAAYADKLRDRLARVRAEMEAQGARILEMKGEILTAEDETAKNNQEIKQLRAQWTAEKPQRDELLRETAEMEQELVEKERLSALGIARQGKATPPAATASADASDDNGERTEANDGGGKTESASAKSSTACREQERECRQRVSTLEASRTKLTQALSELREAARGEDMEIGQLRARIELLKQESAALRTGTAAAHEGKQRRKEKLRDLEATEATSKQRALVLEKQVRDLKADVQKQKDILAAAPPRQERRASKGAETTRTGSGPPAKAAKAQKVAADDTCAHEVEDMLWLNNRRLQAKVLRLREELESKRAETRSRLHEQNSDNPQDITGKEGSMPEATAAAVPTKQEDSL
mmetsp:Transcript_278/g.936  ORF Transcript_278/g.936 Transcript_278/m.936 type:complete len:385 (-) Transcript_278:32-1186(-)